MKVVYSDPGPEEVIRRRVRTPNGIPGAGIRADVHLPFPVRFPGQVWLILTP